MTSTDDRRSHSRSYIPPQGAPVPQPDFTNQGGVSQLQSHTGLGDPLEYLTPPAVGHQHVQAGLSHPAPQHDAGDVFGGIGLSGPARYVNAGGILQPQDFRRMAVDTPMPAPTPHRTHHPVRDSAFNNIHRGQMAHRGREVAYRQSARDLEFVSLHQTDREIGQWVIPDEHARHARNENRRRLHLPEEPPSRLHMDMSRQHEIRQQRISALEPFCISGRSAPQQDISPQARERQERQERIAELRTRRIRNESKRAAAAKTKEQTEHEHRMAQQTAQARVHERRMAQWNAQRIQDEMRREQERRYAQQMQDEMRREQARQEQVHQEREAQHILGERRREEHERRREEEERAQQMQSDMRHIQAIEQAEHQQRAAQLEAQRLQNDIRLANRAAAAEREENEILSQMAQQFQREQEAQADVIRREQEERDYQDAIRYDQARLAENAARMVQEAEEAAAEAQAEAAAQAEAEAAMQAQIQAAMAAAQAGQLDQFHEALRQQNLPPGRKTYQEPPGRHSLGPMNVECQHCHALHWDSEKLTASTLSNKKFGQCCLQGQVDLPPFPPPPPTLKSLLSGTSPFSNTFRKHIPQYNAAFAFTSLGVNIDHSVTSTRGPYAFKINGELHHLSGALLPEEGQQPSYAQLYVHDPAEALNVRGNRNVNLLPQIMTELQAMMHETHPYVPLYKQAFQIMRAIPPDQQKKVVVKLHVDKNADGRRYNLPTTDEIAAIIPGDGSEERSDHRDIVVRLTGGGLKRISHLHPSYSTLHYTMLFPRGEEGYHIEIPMNAPEGGRSKHVSQRCYYAFRLQRRPGEAPALLMGGRLLQQYVVDAWASTEQSELNWIRHHQKELRADAYQDLRNAARDGADAADKGQRVILPSTHLGSPRHMYQLFQNSMAICRHCRKPDLFLTMTTNPNWPEIKDALLKDATAEGKRQEASDRPDIVARVFVQKMQSLLKDIRNGLYGKVAGMVYTVEFQKRGLPHMHLLIFLDQQDKIRNPKDVDDIVSAQIPDPAVHPLLYETVTKHMVHGPCGPGKPSAVCMVDGVCSKHYPRDFQPDTIFGDSGYPEYARPENGRTFTDRRGNLHDNRDIVPHNPYLSAKYG